jgi:formylglycine-generating enzyme
MNGTCRLTITCVVVAIGAYPAPDSTFAAQAGKKYAICVGVERYDPSQLRRLSFAEDDARALAEELRMQDYEVLLMTSEAEIPAHVPSTSKKILDLVSRRAAQLEKRDTLIVTLSGHGLQFKDDPVRADGSKESYFCPEEAVRDDRSTLLPLDRVMAALVESPAERKLLLVDACRNEVRPKGSKDAAEEELEPAGLLPRTVPKGMLALFSCASKEESLELPELEHGVFCYHILKFLRGEAGPYPRNELSVGDLASYVRRETRDYVFRVRNADQSPVLITPGGELVDWPLGRLAGPRFAGTRAGQERDDNALKMKFCWCPPGKFLMGSPPGEPDRSHNEDQVQVTLTRGFWLGKFEVTQAQWESVMGTTVNEQRAKAEREELSGTGPDHPMYYVSHDEATAFCVKLTAGERAAGRLPSGAEYRLPTEAQWEYSCRAGTTTATAFGDSLSSIQANFDGDYPYNGGAKGPDLGQAAEVGKYPANGWGLYDMHGNVWEWCRDAYEEKLPGGNDPDVPQGSIWISRGGCWYHHGQFCRSAFRDSHSPDSRSDLWGFRVALSPSGN